VPGAPIRPKAVPRRRREVFEKSGGKCFYCGTALRLDGKWHIEHQMPRALMGPDELLNLVAACVPCNLSKGDSTALEFLATRRSA
jgi:5-methylcytosine-specific restriction endonuclease McrA